MVGIRFAHIENSLPDPFQDAPLLKLLLRGIKRSVGITSQRRLPITIALLRQIKTEVARAPDILPEDKLRLWSAFTLAFYGFLRSSEFTSPSTTQFHPHVHLSWSDISFSSDGSLSLQLKASKTDPYRQGCSLLLAPSGRSVCAIQALRKYLALSPPTKQGPLYVFHSGLYLTRAKATSVLRLLLQRIGVPTEHYASHSFRIGAATTAAEAGLPPWLNQTLGGGPATALPFISEPHLPFFREYPASLPLLPPQHRASGTHRKDVALLYSHNFYFIFAGNIWELIWVHTCHLALHVAGWVGP